MDFTFEQLVDFHFGIPQDDLLKKRIMVATITEKEEITFSILRGIRLIKEELTIKLGHPCTKEQFQEYMDEQKAEVKRRFFEKHFPNS